jgi:hypothetical protein
VLKARLEKGLDLDATTEEIERALYAPGALVLELTPRQKFHDTEELHRLPRYRWRLMPARDPRD